jgi:hydrogenase-4 component F
MTALVAILFIVQLGLSADALYPVVCRQTYALTLSDDFSIDRLSALFMLLTQLVAACSMAHSHVFFKIANAHTIHERQSVRLFYTCCTLFVAAMTVVFVTNNFGFLWIAIEATTLCSAPLIYFHRSKSAVEAAWKYLMICSVGIAFALFGTICIFASSQSSANLAGSLNFSILQERASTLQYPLLRLGFLLCLVGYGTKAGIFPLHSWLPDAHSEAPAPASAMLSGGLLNCALFAIWRTSLLLTASGHGIFVEHALLFIGVLTVFVASIFLIRQYGIKRLFAYSSIENVGLMMTAIALGSGPLFFLLALNHSVAKVALFLLSGNIIQATGTKSLNKIRGLLTVSPLWSALLVMAAIAVTGAPPFGSFAAEWMLLADSSRRELWPVVAVLSVALAISFISLSAHVTKMLFGKPCLSNVSFSAPLSSAVPALLVVLMFLLGVTAVPKLIW